MAELAYEKERNAMLKATLSGMMASEKAAAPSPVPASVINANKNLAVINLQEQEATLKHKIEQKELAVQHLLAAIKEDKEDQKKVVGEMDAIRNSGKAVWETVGWATHAYHDPFHTGLSKRTPTGEHLLPDVAN